MKKGSTCLKMYWGLFGGEKKCTEKGRVILSPKETEGIIMFMHTAALGEWRKRNGKF